MVNVAYFMQPADAAGGWPKRGRILLRAGVFIVGILLTISLVAWLITIEETALKFIPGAGHWTYRLAAAGVCAFVALMILVRKYLLPQNSTTSRLAWTHAIVAAAFGVVAFIRPAQWGEVRTLVPWPTVLTPNGKSCDAARCIELRLDAMTTLVTATAVITLLCAIAVLLAHWRLGKEDPNAAPSLAGAGRYWFSRC